MKYANNYHFSKRMMFFALCILLPGCSRNLPAYDYTQRSSTEAPASEKIAALVANVKCSLYDAANDDQFPIPLYFDDPELISYVPGLGDRKASDVPYKDETKAKATLKDMFEEIQFTGSADLEIDATELYSLSASPNFIDPLSSVTNGPSFTAIIAGSYSHSGHRNIDIAISLDTGRLLASPSPKGYKAKEEPPAFFVGQSDAKVRKLDGLRFDDPHCNHGDKVDLAGDLQLKEDAIYYFEVHAMNDIAWLPGFSAKKDLAGPKLDQSYEYPKLQVTLDATLSTGLSGGPQWSLSHFKGPGGGTVGSTSAGSGSGGSGSSGGGGGSNPLSFSRSSKDTVILSLYPVCIREKYRPISAAPLANGFYDYGHTLHPGSPRWASTLPPCNTPDADIAARRAGAAAKADINAAKSAISSPN